MSSESEFKSWIIQKAGESYEKERKRAEEEIGQEVEWNGNVTVEIIVEYMASQFPELVLSIAEENFIIGYRQGLLDVEASERNENEQKPA